MKKNKSDINHNTSWTHGSLGTILLLIQIAASAYASVSFYRIPWKTAFRKIEISDIFMFILTCLTNKHPIEWKRTRTPTNIRQQQIWMILENRKTYPSNGKKTAFFSSGLNLYAWVAFHWWLGIQEAQGSLFNFLECFRFYLSLNSFSVLLSFYKQLFGIRSWSSLWLENFRWSSVTPTRREYDFWFKSLIFFLFFFFVCNNCSLSLCLSFIK